MSERINPGYEEFIKGRRGGRFNLRLLRKNAPNLPNPEVIPDPEERMKRALPIRIQEYLEVGDMLNSNLYPPHKQVLLRETRLRLIEQIQEDPYLFQSLMTWNLRHEKQERMR